MNRLVGLLRSIGSSFVSALKMLCVSVALIGLSLGSVPLYAADVYWDPDAANDGNNETDGSDLGGAGTWDTTSSQWWNGSALGTWSNSDTAIFTNPFANPSSLKSVVLNTDVTAGGLTFLRSDYAISGSGTLTLDGSAILRNSYATSSTIGNIIAGTSGLNVAGGGSVKLTGANTYTGTTNIDNGSLIITGQDGLGASTSAININGSSTRAFGGGSLILDGSAGGITLTRDLNVRGRGPTTDRGISLISVGDNTISSTVNVNVDNNVSRITASTGTLTFDTSSTIDTSGSTGTSSYSRYNEFGSINGVKLADIVVNGAITGDGGLLFQGGNQVHWNPNATSGFTGQFRVQNGSFQPGGMLITSTGVLGDRTATGTASVLDMNGGIVEVRMDNPTLQVNDGSNANAYFRSNATFALDNAGGLSNTTFNQTLNLGDVLYEESRDFIVETRNGFGLTVNSYSVNGGDNSQDVFNRIEGGGLLTITGDFSGNDDSGSRTYRFEDNGDTLITGGFMVGAGGNKILHKDGIGTLTIAGTNTSFEDVVEVTRGTIAITDFDSLGNGSTDTIEMSDEDVGLGSSGPSTLQIGGAGTGTPTASGLITSRNIDIVANSNNDAAIIRAMHTTSDAIDFNGNIVSSNSNTNTFLILDGTNTADNTISGVISDNSTGTNNTSVRKGGSGTWMLDGVNTYTGETRIDQGTLKIKANAATSTIIADASEIRFELIEDNQTGPDNTFNDFANSRGGGNFEFVGNADETNVETLGALNSRDGANTVRLTAGGGTGTASLVFDNLSAIQDDSTLNFDLSGGNGGNITFTNYTTQNSNIDDAKVYVNGSDFALINFDGVGSGVRAPVYDTDASFSNATDEAPFSAGDNINLTADVTTTAARAIESLRIDGSTANTLDISAGDLTIGTGGAQNEDAGIILTGGSATITGSTITTGGTALGNGGIVIRVDGASNTLTVNSAIQHSAQDGDFILNGEGTLEIGGLLSLDGTGDEISLLGSSTLVLGTGGNIQNGRNLKIGHDATLDLNGKSESFRDFRGGGTILNTSSSDITLGISRQGTFTGIINETDSGKISLSYTGNQDRTMEGLNTYTGTTTIESNGRLIISNLANGGSASGIGASSSDASNLVIVGQDTAPDDSNGYLDLSTLRYDGWDSATTDRLFTFGSTATGAGAAISNSGPNNASLAFTNTGALGFGAGTDNVNQTLFLTGNNLGDSVFLPQITDNPSGTGVTSVLVAPVSDTASVAWIVGGTNNTYTGTTTVGDTFSDNNDFARYVAVDGDGLPTTSDLVIQDGHFASNGTFERTLVQVADLTGDGKVAFNGANGNTGFSAADGDLTIAFGGVGSEQLLTWGDDFNPGGNDLRLGDANVGTGVIEITNNINLGATTRQIEVYPNAHSTRDYAVLSGVLSGAGAGLTLNNGGTLRLSGDNTYTGATTITNGELAVQSLGSTTGGDSSSVGASAVAAVATFGSAVRLNGTGNNPATLIYEGSGEVSDRYVNVALGTQTTSTNRDARIYANGSGPLVLENLVLQSGSSNRTLTLRGDNAAENMITSDLAGGAIGLVSDGSATWILTGANTFTGTVHVNAGALGVGSNTALGAGLVSLNNGILFAYGADRTLSSNTFDQDNNTTTGFVGEHSLTLDGDLTKLGNNNWSWNNYIDSTNGDSLTLTGNVTANSLNANRTWTFNGNGNTNIGGSITTSTTRNISLNKNGSGTLNLAGTASDLNEGQISIDNGVVQLGASEVIPHGAGEVVRIEFHPDISASESATLDLNGFNETINSIRTTSSGPVFIDNTGSNNSTLTIGADSATATYAADGSNTLTIRDTGSGTLSLQKTGTGTATFSGASVVLLHSGSTGVDGGGTLNIGSTLAATTGLTATGAGSILDIDSIITAPSGITTVSVNDGAKLDIQNGSSDAFTGVSNLSLANTSGVTLALDNNDSITLVTNGASNGNNQVTIDITDLNIDSTGATPYRLIDATAAGTGGLTSSGTTYALGTTPGYLTSLLNLDSQDTYLDLTVSAAAAGNDIYWGNGAGGNSWNTAGNFTTDAAGTTAYTTVPLINDTAIFVNDTITGGGAVTTTLDDDFRVNALQFRASTDSNNTPSSVTINPGTGSYLGISPSAATDGIDLNAGSSSVTIGTALRILGDQQWDVADASNTLTISGALQGNGNVAIVGAGTTTLSGTADSTLFNGGGTSNFTVTNGTLIDTNGEALGAGDKAAQITIGAGGAYYATNGSPDNAIELAGGTLSLGNANRTYDGLITTTADSVLNTRHFNDSDTTVDGRTMTFRSAITGSNTLTIQGQSDANHDGDVVFQIDATGANASINADTSGFSGDWILQGGELYYDEIGWNGASNFQTQGDITLSGANGARSRVRWDRIGAERDFNMTTRNIIVSSASGNAEGDILLNDADETRTGASTTGKVKLGGLTLGGSGGTGLLYVDYSDGVFSGTDDARMMFEFSDAITLANGGIITGQDNNVRTDFLGGINDGGNGYELTIRGSGQSDTDGFGGITHLAGDSTGNFSGDVRLDSGTLRVGNAGALGSGSIIFDGGAISSSVDGLTIANNIEEADTDQIRFYGDDDKSLVLSDDFAIPGSRTIRTKGDLTIEGANTSAKETITFSGAITGSATSNGTKLALDGNTQGAGVISGGYTQSGNNADVTVNGGEWTFNTTVSRIADILTINSSDAIVNLEGDGTNPILTFGSSAQIRVQNNATLKLLSNNTVDFGNSPQLRIGADNASGPGTLNTNGYDIGDTTLQLILGNPQAGRSGIVTGSGTISARNFDLYEGSIAAGLVTSAVNDNLDKFGPGTVTLSGDNTGLTSTGRTRIYQGDLILDYTSDTNQKISNGSSSELEMRGGTLTLNGHASTAVIEDIGVTGTGNDQLRLNDGDGYNVITLNNNGADIGLRFGQIVRFQSDGTILFDLSNAGTSSATNGIITDEGNSSSGVLDSTGNTNRAYAVVKDTTGEIGFAINSGGGANGNIGALTSSAKDDITTWATGDHVTDSSGFTGSSTISNINSLRFDAAADSTVNVTALGIASGGILITDDVTSGTQSITGSTLDSSAENIIVHNYGTNTFEIGSEILGNDVLTISGTGTTRLTGNYDSTGNVVVWGGTLETNGVFDGNQNVYFSAGSDATWRLTADESVRQILGGRQDFNAQIVAIDIGTNTLTINNNGNNRTYDGDFVGSGTVIVKGTHDFTIRGEMSNNNTPDNNTEFTGDFLVDGGKLRLDLRFDARQASGFTVQNGGSLEFDKRGSTRDGNMIGDVGITLISADGGAVAEARGAVGLSLRSDQTSNNSEDFGTLTLGGGSSYVGIDGTNGNGDDPFLEAASIVRNNASTLNIRGTNLGEAGSSGRVGRFLIADSGETSFTSANQIGGGGANGSTSLSIVPWAIGQDLGTSGNVNATAVGNSFLTYRNDNGFRALDLSSEYAGLSSASSTTNIRESLNASESGISSLSVNSLVIDNNNTAALGVTGAGAGTSFANTSGGFLFTVSNGTTGTTYETTLSGFDDGITTTASEYIFHVVNPNFDDATIANKVVVSSPLSSSGAITKSGRGTLVLSGTNTAGAGSTGTTVNEGTLIIADNDNIGGDAGGLNFGGGTLQLTNAYADDLTGRTISYVSGTSSTLDLDGNDLTFGNSLGSGAGGLTLTNGSLTLNATSTRSGATTFLTTGNQTLTLGANNAIGSGGDFEINYGGITTARTVLALGSSNLDVANFTVSGNGGGNPTIAGTGTITATNEFFFNNTGDTVVVDALLAGNAGLRMNGSNSSVNLRNGSNTFTGRILIDRGTLTYDTIGDVGGGASSLGNPGNASDATIRLAVSTSDAILRFDGNTNQSSNRIIALTGAAGGGILDNDGSGSSTLDLGKVESREYGTKNLTFRGASGSGAASIQSLQGQIGTISIIKEQSKTWTIREESAYTGTTTVGAGTLIVNGNSLAASAGAVTVAAGATLGGSGDIGGAATITGNHHAGSTVGTTGADFVGKQDFVGNLTYNGATGTPAIVTWDLISNANTGAGSNFDQFTVAGSLDFSTTTNLVLNFDATGSTTDWTDNLWSSDQTWLIYSGSNAIQNAANLTLVTENWLDSNGGSFNALRGPDNSSFALDTSDPDKIYLDFTAVPEPSTYAVMSLGLAAFGWFARRKRRKASGQVDQA